MSKYYKGSIQVVRKSKYYVGKTFPQFDLWEPRRFHLPDTIETIVKPQCLAISKRQNIEKMNDEQRSVMAYFYDNVVNRQNQYPIIYEIVKDQDNLIYGREILTGLIFPLSNYTISKHEYFITPIFKNGFSFPHYKFFSSQRPQYHHDNYAKIKNIIINNEIANQNEIDEYIYKFQTSPNHKYKLRKHLKKLSHYYKTNIFNIQPVFKEKQSSTLEKTEEAILMENIEYLLIKLSNHNQELYQKYLSEYQNLLSDTITLKVMPADIRSLKIIENNLKLSLADNKGNASNIIEYLTNLQKDYLEYFLTGNIPETTITIDNLDILYENFLLIAADFSLPAQRQIIRNFSLIYLLEVKENLSHLTPSDLSKSYFSKNLKSIIITINVLNDLGVIEPISIDLNPSLTLDNILYIIESLEFKKYEQVQIKELIKKLS